MDDIIWNRKYLVGVDQIDLQHQCFVGIINDLANKVKNSASKGVLDGKLLELYKYTDYHFCSEELVMIEEDYPDYEKHRLMHVELLRELNYKIENSENGIVSVDEIIRFLFLWFVGHTIDEDIKLGHWIRSK